jgi:F-box/leucine-rich repeat protein 2/20
MVGCPFVNDVGLQFLENGCPLLQVSYLQCDGVKLKIEI